MENWVKHFAEEERQRQRVRSREAAATTHQVEDVKRRLTHLVDALRDRAARDVEAFAREFPERGLVFEANLLDEGFTVRREQYPEARLTVEPNMNAGTITVNYVIAEQTGTRAPKPMVLELGGQTIETLHFRNQSEQHAFRTIAQLAEYLLVPVFTARLR